MNTSLFKFETKEVEAKSKGEIKIEPRIGVEFEMEVDEYPTKEDAEVKPKTEINEGTAKQELETEIKIEKECLRQEV